MYTLVLNCGGRENLHQDALIAELLAAVGERICEIAVVGKLGDGLRDAIGKMGKKFTELKGKRDFRGDLLFAGKFSKTALKYAQTSGMRCALSDLSCGWPHEMQTSVYSIFRVAVGVRGLPLHIQPTGWDLACEDLLFLAKCKWKSELAAMQAAIPRVQAGRVGERSEKVGKGGLETIKTLKMLNSGTLNSFVSLKLAAAPSKNPYGHDLAPGQGVLPFLGPNHTVVVMFVASSEKILFSYSGTYAQQVPFDDQLNIESRWKRLFAKEFAAAAPIPPTPFVSDFVDVYKGYLPHASNTRDAWIEATVIAVQMEDVNKYHTPLPIEDAWVKSLFFAQAQAFELRVERKVFDFGISGWTWPQLRNVFPPETYMFLEKMHVRSGADLVRWHRRQLGTPEVLHSLIQGKESKAAVIEWLNGIAKEDDALLQLEAEVSAVLIGTEMDNAANVLMLCTGLDLWSAAQFNEKYKELPLSEVAKDFERSETPIAKVLENIGQTKWCDGDEEECAAVQLIFGHERNLLCTQEMLPAAAEVKARVLLGVHVDKICAQIAWMMGDDCKSSQDLRWRGEHVQTLVETKTQVFETIFSELPSKLC